MYYGEIYQTKSIDLNPTIIALEHLARNKPTKFEEWFIRPIVVNVFVFLFGLFVGWLLNPQTENRASTVQKQQLEQTATK